jgi:4-hydroxybenzoyl-CoA reductase subunit beta
MRLPRFEYLRPETIEQACALLLQVDAKVLAGGTELLVHLKQKTVTPRVLVNIKSIPHLAHIERTDDGGLSIGAATTLRELAASELVRDRFGMLAQAAASVGRPRIPNMATIGGNICLDSRCFYYNQSHLWKQSVTACYKDGGGLCHVVRGGDHCNALFVADTVPALIALRAMATITDAAGESQIALEDFYTGRGERVNLLRPGQLLTRVRLPAPSPRSASIYLKYSPREAIDFAVVSVAVTITVEPRGGACREARIVLGSVATGPLRALEAEALLKDKALEEGLLETAARLTAKQARPITHLGISAGHKRAMIETLTKRAVRQAWERAAAGRDSRQQEV